MAGTKPKGKGFGDLPAPLKYGEMKKAFATPGMQKGERAMAKRIAHNRGVSIAKAEKIGAKRTARGVSTAGIAGPKDAKRSGGGGGVDKGRGTMKPKGAGPDLGGLGPLLPKRKPRGGDGEVGITRRKPTGGDSGPMPRPRRSTTRE